MLEWRHVIARHVAGTVDLTHRGCFVVSVANREDDNPNEIKHRSKLLQMDIGTRLCNFRIILDGHLFFNANIAVLSPFENSFSGSLSSNSTYDWSGVRLESILAICTY